MMQPDQCPPANRRLTGQSDGSENRKRDCLPPRRFFGDERRIQRRIIAMSVAVLLAAVGVGFLSSRGVHHAGMREFVNSLWNLTVL